MMSTVLSTTAAAAAPVAQGPAAPLAVRVRASVSKAVPVALYRMARLGPTGGAGIAAAIAAVVIAITAFVTDRNGTDSLVARITQAQRHPTSAASATEEISKVIAALPTREQMPAVVALVLQQAKQAGVALDKGQYDYSPSKAMGAGRYELEFPVKADYPSVRKFIDLTLTTVPALGLDRLHIERKGVGDSTVSADVRFVVFVRGEAQP